MLPQSVSPCEDVDARLDLRSPSNPPHRDLHLLLRQAGTTPVAQHPNALPVSSVMERIVVRCHANLTSGLAFTHRLGVSRSCLALFHLTRHQIVLTDAGLADGR